MYYTYKKIDSLKQLKGIENDLNIKVKKKIGYSESYFIGKYCICELVKTKPKKAVKTRIVIYDFNKFQTWFTDGYVLGSTMYKDKKSHNTPI